jgi:chloramphenicol-sensitive protein RarD
MMYAAAKRLRFSTLGFLQYVGPTCQFLVAVFAFHEPFGARNLAGFVCIWIALIIYSIDSWRGYTAPVVVQDPA